MVLLADYIRESLKKTVLRTSQDLVVFLTTLDNLSDAEIVYGLEQVWDRAVSVKSWLNCIEDELQLEPDARVYVCYGGCKKSYSNGMVARARNLSEAIDLMSFFGHHYNARKVPWLGGVVVRVCNGVNIGVASEILDFSFENYPVANRVVISDEPIAEFLQYVPLKFYRCDEES